MLTGEQIKAARAMLRLDQRQFAALVGAAVTMVQRLERARGPVIASTAVLDTLRRTLEDAGVIFIDAGEVSAAGGPGVRLRGVPVARDVIMDLEMSAEGREPVPRTAAARPPARSKV
ncbi:MAG: transcriptional regulator [Acetobacteraceae bacterium]|nr:transcriptional regulator [Acetobacteraceae bacterium]